MPLRRSLAAVSLVALSLTACGGGSDGGAPTRAADALTVLKASAGKTTAAGSSKVLLTSASKVGGQAFTIRGEGAFAYSPQRGSFRLTLSGLPTADIALTMRVVDGTLFLQVPKQSGWYSASLEDIAATSLGSTTDPTASLAYLAGVSDDVKAVGPAEVRGEQTTHYRGTIDVKKLLAALQGPARTAAEKTFGTSGTTSIPFDAYVDDQGRMRKLVQDVRITAQGQAVTSKNTLELFDFGTDVEVVAPPAGEVKDGTALLKGFGG